MIRCLLLLALATLAGAAAALFWAFVKVGGDFRERPLHVHEWTYVPVWTADMSRIEGWWWCTKHEPGEWVRGDDEVAAA